MSPRLVAGAVLLAALVVFCAENTSRTRIRFLIPRLTTPLWIALLAATLVGAAAGFLLGRHRRDR